jgi:plasmid maintenance system antidote protein VapI
MQKEVEKIESELVDRIYKSFIVKYNGNKSAFSKASGCAETTIRRVLAKQQGITINLLVRMAYSLDTTVSDLMNGLQVPKEE